MVGDSWALVPPLPVQEGDFPSRPWEWLPWAWERPRRRSERVMFPHQAVGSRFLLENWGGALFMGMRTGKSLATVDAILRGGIFPHLILCPLSVMATWENEFLEEGLHPSELHLVRAGDRGSQLTRPGALVTVCNFDVVRKSRALRVREESLPPALEIPNWAGITVDESYRIANPEATVTREILRSPRPPGQFRALLSGAPASESGLNLAPQFLFLDGEFFGCRTMVEYLGKFCRPNPRNPRQWVPVNRAHLQAIRAMVAARAYCVSLKDLDLGVTHVYQTWNVEPTAAQEEALLWCKMANTYPGKDANGKDRTMVLEPLVRSTFTSKASAGVHPITGEILSDEKSKMVVAYLVEHETEAALILSRFSAPIGRTVELLQRAGVKAAAITGATPQAERERIRRDFQAGKLRAVVGQVRTVKMGMDFSAAGTLFYLSNSYSQDDRTQSEDRGNHVTKSGLLQVVDLCTRGGNDRKLVSLLTSKKALSQSYIEETLSKWSADGAFD